MNYQWSKYNNYGQLVLEVKAALELPVTLKTSDLLVLSFCANKTFRGELTLDRNFLAQSVIHFMMRPYKNSNQSFVFIIVVKLKTNHKVKESTKMQLAMIIHIITIIYFLV